MCQDTGTAIVMGKKSEGVLTGADDGEAISRGVYDAYTKLNLRYSPARAADDVRGEEHRHQPAGADRDLLDAADLGEAGVQVPLHGQGRRLGQQVVPVPGDQGDPQPASGCWSSSTRRSARSAPPPARRTTWRSSSAARRRSSRSRPRSTPRRTTSTTCRRRGSMAAHGFRDLELEEQVFELTQSFGIGAQFGGKYFCHDVRVVRLPRHGASCPVAIAVSCSADRQALGKITPEGVFLEQLETDPAQYMPAAGVAEDIAGGEVVQVDLNRPMTEILAAALAVPGQDAALAHRPAGRGARHRARQDQGAPRRRRGDAGSTCATTRSTTPGRPRPPRAWRPDRSARPRPGGWTPTSSSSRPPAARW